MRAACTFCKPCRTPMLHANLLCNAAQPPCVCRRGSGRARLLPAAAAAAPASSSSSRLGGGGGAAARARSRRCSSSCLPRCTRCGDLSHQLRAVPAAAVCLTLRCLTVLVSHTAILTDTQPPASAPPQGGPELPPEARQRVGSILERLMGHDAAKAAEAQQRALRKRQ